MATRNQHPAQLLVMHMPPAEAAVLPAGRVAARANAAYSSLYLLGFEGATAWQMDGEYLRAATDLRLGIGHGLQLGIELAGAHTSGGFLDDFIIDYHDAFGFPDQGRDSNPRDDYRIEASDGSDTVWAVDRRNAEWLDTPIVLTWQLSDVGDRRLGVAVRGGVELPTGDQNRGFGSGEVETSLGAVLDYRIGGIACYGHLQHTFARTPDRPRSRGLRFGDVTSAGGGFELALAEGLHALVQVEWETSTLRDLGPEEAATEQALLWFGGRWSASPQWSVELGLGEDLQGYASPDFTVWLGLTWLP